MAKSSVTMKLLIDTQANRVIFAEASKDCVDFLFLLLTLPIATAVQLLKNQGVVGSLANLYKSIENLNESYLQPNQHKDALLQPPVSQPYDLSVPLLLLDDSSSTKLTKFYTCGYSSSHRYVTKDSQTDCPSCRHKLATTLTYVDPPGQQVSREGGFVKGLVSYMVKENLEVEPMSTVSCIALLNRFKVKDVSSLEEKVVDLGMDEAIMLLKVSLHSNTVLTDVFLKGKK